MKKINTMMAGLAMLLVPAATWADNTPPANYKAALDGNNVVLTWEAPADGSTVTGYQVSRNGSEVATLGADEYRYEDGTLDIGTYSYTVSAVYGDATAATDAQEVEVFFTLHYQQPYGWQLHRSGSSYNFGTKGFNATATTEKFRLYTGTLTASDIAIAQDDKDHYSVTVGDAADDGGQTYYPLTITANSGTAAGSFPETLRFTYGAETFSLALTMTVENLDAATIKEFKQLTAKMKYNTRLNYTGAARINLVMGNDIYASDETGDIHLVYVGTDERIKPGALINFTAWCQSVNPAEDSPAWTATQIGFNEWPNWQMPERETITSALTTADYGKVVSVKNVTFDNDDVVESYYGYGPSAHYMTFKDADGNSYLVYQYSGNYSGGLDESLKGQQLELVGAVVNIAKSYGAGEPGIDPLYIRPVTPKSAMKSGTYALHAYSYPYDANVDYDVTIEADEENPYKYKFHNFLKGMNQNYALDFYGELTPGCDTLVVLSGQNLWESSSDQTDIYLATWAAFDRNAQATSTSTPPQTPLPKGTEINIVLGQDGVWTTDSIMDYMVNYRSLAGDPVYGYLQYSHYDILGSSATLTYVYPYAAPTNLTATTNDQAVTLSWQAPEIDAESGHKLTGYRIYSGESVFAETDAETTTYVINNMRTGTYTFSVVALYEKGEDTVESDPSNTVTVDFVASGISTATTDVNAQAEYYTLDGRQVKTAKNGVFIEKKNGTTRKVIIR